MAANLKPIKFTDRTSETILDSMVSQIPSITQRWTDFNPSDTGITILELLSWGLENLIFSLDRQANESFLETARERKNVIRLCKLIAYKLNGVVSSTTSLTFSLTSPATVRIEIPKFTRCTTNGDPALTFATVESAFIPVGESSVTVGARQGEPTTDTFTTIGTPSQVFILTEVSADEESIELTIDGVIWKRVDSFSLAQGADRVFVVTVGVDGEVSITLGDGFFGYLPGASATTNVQARYLVSDGSGGIVGSHTIKTIQGKILDVLGNEAPLSVVNLQAATGGDDAETIEHAKIQAPAELSALFRAMTKADFIALADGYPGVGKANAWGEAEVNPPNYNQFNSVNVVVAPENVTRAALIDDPVLNGQPSSELKAELLTFFHDRSTITTKVRLLDPSYLAIDVELNVFHRPEAVASTVKSAVQTVVEDFFLFDNVTFAKELRLSNLMRLTDEVPGVDYIEVVRFKTPALSPLINNTITLQFYELPYLNDFTINIAKGVNQPPVPSSYPYPPAPPLPPFD